MIPPETVSVLVVDDDKNVASLVEQVLKGEGYAVHTASNMFQARGAVQRSQPDIIVLDRRLPDGDGVDFCLELRKRQKTQNIPVLFLTAKKEVPDRVSGLQMGGDDYLTKPFNPEELAARVKAVLRRTKAAPEAKPALQAGPLRLDLEARRAFLKNKEIALSAKEYDLLKAFLEHSNRILSRETLLQLVWGPGKEMQLVGKTVDVAIGSLRNKLGGFGSRITAVRGYGFRFDWKESR